MDDCSLCKDMCVCVITITLPKLKTNSLQLSHLNLRILEAHLLRKDVETERTSRGCRTDSEAVRHVLCDCPKVPFQEKISEAFQNLLLYSLCSNWVDWTGRCSNLVNTG